MGPIRCPETSVKGYHSTVCNTPGERRSHQHRNGSLKSRLKKVGDTKTTFINGSCIKRFSKCRWLCVCGRFRYFNLLIDVQAKKPPFVNMVCCNHKNNIARHTAPLIKPRKTLCSPELCPDHLARCNLWGVSSCAARL
jgi:hypothetical protein